MFKKQSKAFREISFISKYRTRERNGTILTNIWAFENKQKEEVRLIHKPENTHFAIGSLTEKAYSEL